MNMQAQQLGAPGLGEEVVRPGKEEKNLQLREGSFPEGQGKEGWKASWRRWSYIPLIP